MARTFEQVLADITKQSDPQRQTILKTVADLPNQQAAEEASLAAKKDQAYTDILDGARRRGTGVAFGGIPLSEQAKYNATEYAPAVARMKTGFNDRKTSLEMALADIGKNDYSNAYNIFNTERAFEEQQRQFNEQMAESRRQAARAAAAAAAQSADLSRYFSQSSEGAAQKAAGPSISRNSSGGFTFKDAGGKAITAGMYARQTGADIRDVLYEIGASGDKTAAALYNALRPAKDGQQVASIIQRNGFDKKYGHIFNGYSAFGGNLIGGK